MSEGLGKAHLDRLVGTQATVLVEGPGKTGAWEGRTERNEIVHVDATGTDGRDLAGTSVAVTITSAFKHSLAGQLTAESLQSLPAPGERTARPPRRRRLLPLVAE